MPFLPRRMGSKTNRARPATSTYCSRIVGRGDRRRRRGDQPGRPQRRLPLQRSAIAREIIDSRVRVDARRRRGDRRARRIRRMSGCRPARPRSTRIASTPRTTNTTASSAATSRTRRRRGASASRSARPWEQRARRREDAAHAQGEDAHGDGDDAATPERRSTIFLSLVRFGLGGADGDGRQFVSWIHHDDFVRAIRLLIDQRFVDGVVNIAAPNPLPNAEFMKAIREAWGMPFGIPRRSGICSKSPRSSMRTETELLLKSRRVDPGTSDAERLSVPAIPTLAGGRARALRRMARRCTDARPAAPRAQPTW